MMSEPKNNKKILIVEVIDDERSLCDVLHDKLTREGFSVLEAKNGEEGLKIALSMRPDLILLDILMPKMDGVTMMRKLRQENEWGKKVPVIILTNLNPSDEKINKAIEECEPAFYIIKSNQTINELIDKIRERLSR